MSLTPQEFQLLRNSIQEKKDLDFKRRNTPETLASCRRLGREVLLKMRDMVFTGTEYTTVKSEKPFPFVDGCLPILSKEFGITMTKPRPGDSRIYWVRIAHDVDTERTVFTLFDNDLY